MTIVLTGGGSGGHITPILAVAAELKRLQPNAKLIYIGQRGDSLSDIPAQDPNIDEVFTVRAGKFRRFHNEGLKQLLDIPTLVKNIRDAFYVIVGTYQSWRLMKRIQPDVLFSRGGFVSVPVAIGAKLRHIPYITHDSDAIPSLANRIIAPWARVHAVTFDKTIYPYPPEKTVTTGIPLNKHFQLVTDMLRNGYRKDLGLPDKAKVVFIIGGGLGAQQMNLAVSEAVLHLTEEFKDLYVIHAVGRDNETEMQSIYNNLLESSVRERVQVHAYISDVYRYSGAADVVITRAGATNLAEFAVQGKACIIVPGAFLAGGHQTKNAEYIADQGAGLVLKGDDLTDDPNRLATRVSDLLIHPAQRQKLGAKFATLANPGAAERLAKLILEQI